MKVSHPFYNEDRTAGRTGVYTCVAKPQIQRHGFARGS